MRQLFIYAAVGSLVGLMITGILMSIALPHYNDYLMPLEMANEFTVMSDIGSVMLQADYPYLSFAVITVSAFYVWFVIAGKVNPAMARIPFSHGGRNIWMGVAWISGGILITISIFSIATWSEWFSLKIVPIMTMLAILLAGGVSWALISPQAFGRFNRDHVALLHWPTIARVIMMGTLYALFFGLLLSAAEMVFTDVALKGFIELFDHSLEPSLLGWGILTVTQVILAATVLMLALGLVTLFLVGEDTLRVRLQRVKPGLYLLVMVIGATLLAIPVLHYTHFLGNQTLAAAAKINITKPLVLHQVVFCPEAPCRVAGDTAENPALAIGKPINKVSTYGIYEAMSDLPLDPSIVPQLETFINTRGKHSVLRKAAIYAAQDIYTALWQPHEISELFSRLLQRGDIKDAGLLQTQIQLAWLMHAAPVTAENRAILENYSDSNKYYIGAKAAARLASAWARFGDMTRANAMLVKARQLAPDKYTQLTLTPGILTNGSVEGQLELTGKSVTGVRLGLFRSSPSDLPNSAITNSAGKPNSMTPVSQYSTSRVKLTESVMLPADGHFHFEHLGEGDYFIALLIPDTLITNKSVLHGEHVPGKITLQPAHSKIELGTIQLFNL